jgi:predicted transcriptional regulator of viral defense system
MKMTLFDAKDLVVDTLRMKYLLGSLSDQRGKIARMIHAGELIQLRRGLYATRQDLHPYCLAAFMYGPSYISYEAALSYHGLIPEAVHEIMSATLKRPASFENDFGRYRYHKIPRKVYPIGLERVREAEIPFLIASPTKALCDRIALEPGMRSMRDVLQWVRLMRISEAVEWDEEVLIVCADHYRSPAVRLLQRLVTKHGGIPL